MPNNPLLETWQIHDRINLYLLDAVDPSSLDSHSASKSLSGKKDRQRFNNK